MTADFHRNRRSAKDHARRERNEMIKVGIIVGSTRPGRKAAAVAKWVHDLLKNRNDAEFEIVDIEDYKPAATR
jgi:hypothetical protein